MSNSISPGITRTALEIQPAATSTAKTPPKHRLNYIDSLRAIAAMFVIVTHTCQHIWWQVTPEGKTGVVFVWLMQGHYAVVAFIVLSGFCLMRPVVLSGALRGGVWEFYKGRALRILPAYWAAMLTALLLIATLIGQKHGTLFDLGLPVTAQGVFCHFVLINNFWGQTQMGQGGNPQINPVFWTIALEWQIYFWFPLLVWMWKRVGMLLTLIVSAVVLVGVHHSILHLSLWGLNPDGMNLYFYFYFVLGMMAATLVLSEKRSHFVDARLFHPLAIVLIVGYVFMYAAMLAGKLGGRPVEVMELYTALMMVAILVSGALGGLKLLSWQPLVNIGMYSYSVYLLHLPLLALLTDYIILPLRGHISRNMEFGLLLCLGFPVILFCSKRFASIFEDKKQITRYWDRLRLMLKG